MKARIVAFALTLAGASPGLAQEGVIEINQARVLAGGVTEGDTGGFPVTLSVAGSYRLASDLVSSNPNSGIIWITSDNVVLDLGGFALVGPATCTGSPVTACSDTGLGTGVVASGQRRNVTVRNGTVRGAGLVGVALGPDSRVENVAAFENGSVGIYVEEGSTVLDCIAARNGAEGILAGDAVAISGNIARHNGTDGIEAGAGATLSGNVASANGADGLHVGSASTLTANAAHDNGDDGIQSLGGAVVGCAVASNTDLGLSLGSSTGFAQCVAGENNAGDGNEIQTAGGRQIGLNFCTSAAHDAAYTSMLCP